MSDMVTTHPEGRDAIWHDNFIDETAQYYGVDDPTDQQLEEYERIKNGDNG